MKELKLTSNLKTTLSRVSNIDRFIYNILKDTAVSEEDSEKAYQIGRKLKDHLFCIIGKDIYKQATRE